MDEVWKPVIDYEDRYEVSNLGRVRSKERLKQGRNKHGPFSFITPSKIIKQQMHPEGYVLTSLFGGDGKKTTTAHILVAKAFIPNPLGLPQVNHKDSDRANNSVSNLEWVTAQQNVQHSYDEGLNSNALDLHPMAVLSTDLVKQIRKMREDGMRVVDIASKLGFKYHTVHKVVSGKNWSKV